MVPGEGGALRTLKKMTNYIMILEHEDGKVRYFGPLDNTDKALKVSGAYFGYQLSPYTVSFVPLMEPLGSKFLECKKEDGE